MGLARPQGPQACKLGKAATVAGFPQNCCSKVLFKDDILSWQYTSTSSLQRHILSCRQLCFRLHRMHGGQRCGVHPAPLTPITRHFTEHTKPAQYTHHTLHLTVYIVHHTLPTVHCAALYTTLYTVHYTVHCAQCTVHSAHKPPHCGPIRYNQCTQSSLHAVFTVF